MGDAHVVLVGLMGAGKTTVGRKAAKLLGRPFVDADDALVQQTGRTVPEWFATEGEAGFRRAETDVLCRLLDDGVASVVAAGGGVVVAEASRRRLALPDVFVVWLRADPAFLATRVSRKAHRPLLTEDPLETLSRLSAEREPWYGSVADAVVDVAPAHDGTSRPKWRLAEQVAEAVEAHDAITAAPS